VTKTIAVVMPAFNESAGIKEFLLELAEQFDAVSVKFLIVDDCSTDSTWDVLQQISASGLFDLEMTRNERNLGHGPSTIKALTAGLESGQSVIVACDGDGQIGGADMRKVVDALDIDDVVVVEGVRVARRDALFRRVVSQATRLLVFLRTGKLPRDANTPFRAYRRSALEVVLQSGRIGEIVPNLDISTYVRTVGMKVLELSVNSRPRRGPSTLGSTWSGGNRWIPSRKFVMFCFRALRDWVRRRTE